MNRTFLIAMLLIAAAAGCTSAPDPTNPYGTWEFTFAGSDCADGDVVEVVRLADDETVYWPAPDGEVVPGPEMIVDVTSSGFHVAVQNGDGEFEAFVTLGDAEALVSWTGDDGCELGARTAAVVKLEDE